MGLTLDEKTRRVANSPDIQPLRRNDGIRIKKQKQVRKQVHIVHSPHASRGGGGSERHYSGENRVYSVNRFAKILLKSDSNNSTTRDSGFKYQGLSPRPGAESHGKFQVCVLSARGSAAQYAATHLWDPIMCSLRLSLRWKPGM